MKTFNIRCLVALTATIPFISMGFADPASNGTTIKTVFVIALENHNWTQPANQFSGPRNQWTVPLTSFSGNFASGVNQYNGSTQFNYAAKHNPQVFFTDSNGGDDPTPANPWPTTIGLLPISTTTCTPRLRRASWG